MDNYLYFRQRALIERARAISAPTAVIAAIHTKLAEEYESRIAEIEARPPLRLVSSTPDPGGRTERCSSGVDEDSAKAVSVP
ncbi:MAG TPA: hypothetical protein VM913_07805 [Sphingomicrobium sp.]|jgi:hypothetical protein|nr:hypothetical protein [Sphingomicrobium sp.]